MATRAEQFHDEQQRTGRQGKKSAAKKSTKKAKSSAWSRESEHAASKATHAFEATAPGKTPSRESTRGSANRSKSDSAMNLTETKRKGSPENRARKSRAKVVKVRGKKS